MHTPDYTQTIRVAAPAPAAFEAINQVGRWWSADLEGSNRQVGDAFTVRFGKVYITATVTELIPGRQISWLVTDCNKHWLKDPKEWVGTTMRWEIGEEGAGCAIRFTHLGLVPDIECFEVCSDGWRQYLHSLERLITTGEGMPYVPQSTPATA